MDPRFLSRKFILTLIVILESTPLLVFGFLDKTAFLTLVGSTLALYITGNVAQKATTEDPKA